MNPFENERKEIDEFSRDELERMFGPTPPEDMDDAEYLLFISGLEPEDVDVEDKDLDKDDEPIQEPAVCADGRCAPEYDDDLEVPEWPEWQEEDEIEEISTDESLTEAILTESDAGTAFGFFAPKDGKTSDKEGFYLVRSKKDVGGLTEFIGQDGKRAAHRYLFANAKQALKIAALASKGGLKVTVYGVTPKDIDQPELTFKNNESVAPLVTFIDGKDKANNTSKIAAAVSRAAKLEKKAGKFAKKQDKRNAKGQPAEEEEVTPATTPTVETEVETETETAEVEKPEGDKPEEGKPEPTNPVTPDVKPEGPAAEVKPDDASAAKPQNTGRLVGQAIRQVLGKEMDKAATDRLAKNILAAIKKLQGGAK